MKTKPINSPGSLNRASVILIAIARSSSKGSSIIELMSRTGLPRTTIIRVLDNLLSLGWVRRDNETLRYNLGIDLASLGYSAISRNPLERSAASELSALADKLNQKVYLSIRSGLDIVCIGRYESKSEIQIGRGDAGLRGPLGMSQSCMGMLALMPIEEVETIVAANMYRYHRIEGFDELGFKNTLNMALKNGYGTYDNIILDRTTSGLGVAICDQTGYPIAAIGTTFITGWLNDSQREECLSLIKLAAFNIERAIFKQ